MANEKDEDKKAFSSTELASEITKAKAKRTFLEKELHTLETQIYNLETSYLSDTSHIGNLVKGWSGYLSNRSAPPITKKQRFKDSDRIFSLSSVDAVENIESSMNSRDKRKSRRKLHPYRITKSTSRRRGRDDNDETN